MAKPPDFDQIARQLDVDLDDAPAGLGDRYLAARLDVIKATLRLVWNARGEADMRELVEPVGTIVDAIRALDR